MGFDLVTGKQSGRDWARGPGETPAMMAGWMSDEEISDSVKRIPWKKLLIAAGFLAGAFIIIPSVARAAEGKKRRREVEKDRRYYLDDFVQEKTMSIPRYRGLPG